MWAQLLVWLLAWPVPLVLLAVAKPKADRTLFTVLAALGALVWVGVVVSANTSNNSEKAATVASTTTTSRPTTSLPTTTREQVLPTSTTEDPDEASDPSAVGATAPEAA